MEVEGPDGHVFEFPDGTDQAVISRTVRNHYARQRSNPNTPLYMQGNEYWERAQQQPAPQPRQRQPSLAENVAQAGDDFVRGMHQIANGVFLGYGPEVKAAVQAPGAAVAGFFDNGGVGDLISGRPAGSDVGSRLRRAGYDASRTFREERDKEREFIEGGNPVGRFINEIGGSALTGGQATGIVRNTATNMLTRQGAPVTRQAARQISRGADYGTNAALGTVYGSSFGDTAEERQANAAGGALASIPGTWVGRKIGYLINLATRGGRTPDERALRLIMRELEDMGMEPQEITRIANRLIAQAPTEEVLAEIMGSGGLRLGRATANMGRGAGRQAATDALETRATGGRVPDPTPQSPGQTRRVTSIRERVMGEMTRAAHPNQTRSPTDYWDFLDNLRNARAQQGAAGYQALYEVVPNADDVANFLVPAMRDGPREAHQAGARMLAREADRIRARMLQLQRGGLGTPEAQAEMARLQAALSDVDNSAGQLAAFAEGAPPNTVSTRSIDYYQRGLAQMERGAGFGSPEGSALGESRRAFNAMADDVVPEFGDVRTTYGDSIRIEELADEGRRVFNMPEGELDRVMRGANGRGLSLEEFDAFMLGVQDAFEQKLGQSDTGFLARLVRNENWRNNLVRALTPPGSIGPQAAQQAAINVRRFLNRLAREASMQQNRNFMLAGSRTTPLAEDIKALTEGEDEFAFLNDGVRQVIAQGGNPRSLINRFLLGIYDRFRRPGIADPRVQEAMARRLFTRVTRESSRELRDALLAARNDPGLPADLRRWLDRVTAGSAAGSERLFQGEEEPINYDTPMPQGATMREDLGASERAGNVIDGRSITSPAPGLITFPDGEGGMVTLEVGDRGVDDAIREWAAGRLEPVEAPIDRSRPMLENDDGSFSTEETITIEVDGRYFVIPTIVQGRRVDEQTAVGLWRAGGNPEVAQAGSQEEADAIARNRSSRIGRTRAPERAPAPVR